MLQANRAYSTDFNAHRDLICKLAQKGWGRLQQAGVVIDFDDVFQEMSVIYCKAAERYDPSKGFTFTAYLGQAIWHDFNKVAARLTNDQCGLGLLRIEDMGDEEMDYYEMLPDTSLTPEESLINSRAFTDNMRSLPLTERRVVGELLRQATPRYDESGQVIDPEVEFTSSTGKLVKKRKSELSLSEIMALLKLSRKQAAEARVRIGEAFGVSLKGLK